MNFERNIPSFVWVRSRHSGTTYLCPAGVLSDPDKASEEDLRKYCVDESRNPHND